MYFEHTPEIEGYDWMRRIGFELYRVAELRRLRVGDRLYVAHFNGEDLSDELGGHCEAYFERVKGAIRFCASWTIAGEGKTPRVVKAGGLLKLLPGRIIQFQNPTDLEAEEDFRRVCRYASRAIRLARRHGFEMWYPHPYHCHTMWWGMTVYADGFTKYGVPGPKLSLES